MPILYNWVKRLTAATQWLQQKGLKGEIGAGSDDDCIAAVKGALCYHQPIEPQSGVAIARILPEALLPFV